MKNNTDNYEWWAGPRGREAAARIKKYKRNMFIMGGIISIEAVIITGLVLVYFKFLNGG